MTDVIEVGDPNTVTVMGPDTVDVISAGTQGPIGLTGPQGDGIISGGSTGQVLTKASGSDYDMTWTTPGGALVTSVNGYIGAVVLSKSDVGLSNVLNGAQLLASDKDTDGTLAANSDSKIPSQKAVKTYVDTADATKQPLDSDLTAIAGLAPANDDIIQRKSGAWTNRTIAQLKSDLALNNVLNGAQLLAASNLSDVASASVSRSNLGLGATKIGSFVHLGHSWWIGSGQVTNGVHRFQHQGIVGKLAGMLQVPETSIKSLSVAGSYLCRSRGAAVFGGAAYGGWSAAYAFLGPYNSRNHGDLTNTFPLHSSAQQPSPLIIGHGINDAGFYNNYTTANTHLQIRNSFKHALRAVISRHRSMREWTSYYNTSAAATWESGLVFSGAGWADQTVTPSDNALSGGCGPFRKATSNNTDYVEFTIPSDFPGGTIAFSFVGSMNAKTNLLTSMNATDATTVISIDQGGALNLHQNFPASGNYIIVIGTEQMLVTAGQGTTSLTVTRGYNGTAKATHAINDEILMLSSGCLVTWSTNGSNAGITGTTTLQGQGTMGTGTAVVKRFACTAADAGKTIRATVSGCVSGDTFIKAQFDAVWIEDDTPAPCIVENVSRWLAASVAPYAYVTHTQFGDFNTDINTVVAEFDNLVRVADIDAAHWKQMGFFNSTLNATDVTTTVNVTVNDVTEFAALGTGWILQKSGEQMLVTAATPVSGNVYSVTLTRGFNSTTKIIHSTSVPWGCMCWMHTDYIHMNPHGMGARASIIHKSLSDVQQYISEQKRGDGFITSGSSQEEHDVYFGIPDNWYYQAQTAGTIAGNTTFTKDKLWFFPIRLVERAILIDVGIVTGTTLGTSTVARYGIYATDKNRYLPAQLIREFGTAATTGSTTYAQCNTHLVLEAGLYWLAVVNQGTTAGGVRTISAANWIGTGPQYVGSVNTGTSLDPFVAQTGVTGALPSTATPAVDAGPMPFMWARFRKPPYT